MRSSSSSTASYREPPGAVERARQQRAGAGRLEQRDAAVDDLLVEQVPVAEMDDRRLRDAADDLVRARDHRVRAERQRRGRQRRVEGEVRAPGLVDDQRHATGVRDLGQPRHVGDRAEVGRRDDRRPGGARRRLQRPLERLRGDAVGDAELRVELGRHEGRPQAGDHQPVDRARVGVALDHGLAAHVRERQHRDVVALRGAVDQEPAAACSPGRGGERLGLLERRRLGTLVDPRGERGDVEGDGSLAERLDEAGVGRAAALVAGDVEAAGVAVGVGAQRVEIGRLGLRRRLALTAQASGAWL